MRRIKSVLSPTLLDIPIDEYGGEFKADTKYFDPGNKDFMINFRALDLDGLLKKLKSEGIEQVGKMEEYDFGRFAWIVDPEGTKIELWEPGPEMPE